jgi:hypothetical protein
VNRNYRAGRKLVQFFGSMINQALHVLRIKLTRHDCEPAFCGNDARTRWNRLRHSKMTNDE